MPRPNRQIPAIVASGISPDDAKRLVTPPSTFIRGAATPRAVLKTDDVTSAWSDIFTRATGAISAKKLDALGADRLAVIAGIATDKWLALRGMPSVIVSHLHAHVHDLDRLREALVEECDRRRALPSGHAVPDMGTIDATSEVVKDG